MAGRWACAGQRLGAHYTDETGGGLAVVRAARTCRISSDPVENGAQAADLEGKRHELGARQLAGAARWRVQSKMSGREARTEEGDGMPEGERRER